MTQKNKQHDENVRSVSRTLNSVMGQHPTLTAQQRQRIWHKAQTVAPQPAAAPWFAFRRSRALLYPVFVVLLVFGFFSGYVGVVFASGASVPGEILYPIERTAETVWLSLTPNSKRCDVQLALLERRVYEVKALLDAAKPVPTGVLQEIELLFGGLAERAACGKDDAQDILPRLILYRQKIHQLLLENPWIWELHAVLDAANNAIVAFGGEPLQALPRRHEFG